MRGLHQHCRQASRRVQQQQCKRAGQGAQCLQGFCFILPLVTVLVGPDSELLKHLLSSHLLVGFCWFIKCMPLHARHPTPQLAYRGALTARRPAVNACGTAATAPSQFRGGRHRTGPPGMLQRHISPTGQQPAPIGCSALMPMSSRQCAPYTLLHPVFPSLLVSHFSSCYRSTPPTRVTKAFHPHPAACPTTHPPLPACPHPNSLVCGGHGAAAEERGHRACGPAALSRAHLVS